MKKGTWCLECAERGREVLASVMVDGDPLCAACARVASVPEALASTGQEPVVAPEPEQKAVEQRLCRRGCGRLVHPGRCAGASLRPHLELWVKLQALPPGMAEEVENRDRRHAVTTLNHLRKKARGIGRVLLDQRNGSTLYLYLQPKEGK